MAAAPYHPDEFAFGLAELTALVLSTPDVETSLRDVADITAKMLPNHPMVAITLRRNDAAVTVASTGPHATVIDELQRGQGLGPCLEALNTAEPVAVTDMAAEKRWGRYPARMLEQGIISVHSQPLLAGGAAVGTLDLYSTHRGAFEQPALQAISLTAQHTAVLLRSAISTARQTELTAQLQAALASRSIIDQALGITMAQRHCDRDGAFEVLRAASQRGNVKLVTVAAAVIRGVTGADPTPPHFNRPSRSRSARRDI
ncbi:GAF and ANTAR domain-containing protein [Nocardia wallacei]|uniref:Transcription antitermination regulator n=1 Tax=Nocardia wallacei TaxID=480035 RepID=A0A7G1KQV6_9NOCA|nr:GAF and ANTAR domain-containing protein [Nocardia wallacei]BCK57665.1 transcription antitermination regulator [Nocardia wallacei]